MAYVVYAKTSEDNDDQPQIMGVFTDENAMRRAVISATKTICLYNNWSDDEINEEIESLQRSYGCGTFCWAVSITLNYAYNVL